MSNNRIKVTDIDFNDIRENLKTFMRGQSQFSDYNFEGSALAVMLDVLAYNTHYNALYTNLAVNEMFIDSASKRSSVVSIAHNFGYIPASCKASKAIVNVTVTQAGATAQFKVLPKNSSFTTTISGESYTFYTIQDYSAERNGTEYLFEDVEIYEGIPQTFLFVCTELLEKFSLPNSNIDLTTLSITVQPTGEQPDYEKYVLATDVLDLTNDSKIFYVKELENETYQIYFGSNGLGKPIVPGNIITAQYVETNKAAANGASLFTYSGISLGGNTAVETTTSSFGGDEKETVEEIKYNVTKTFYNQNRAVTSGDYAAIVKKEYSDIESISVWGGEDNEPPQYGKVFLAIKPESKPYLTPTEKSFIKQSILKSRNIVSITPEIVDPVYLELEINSAVYYNRNKTTRTDGQLVSAVTNAIVNYRNLNLRKFDGTFRMSKFSTAIDAVDQAIVSNITTFKVYSEIFPKYNVKAEYKLNLGNPIYTELVPEEAFKSTGFYIDTSNTVYYLDDDGVGNVRLYTIIAGTGEKVIRNSSIGTIDYENGIIIVKGLSVINLLEPNFYFIIKTDSYDVISSKNQIIDIPTTRISVTAIQDNISSGLSPSNSTHRFTSSRS